MMILPRAGAVVLLSFLFCFSSSPVVFADADQGDFNRKKNQILGYILGKQLPILHYSGKEMDDERAEAIFALYIKQLDFQKRFLLESDVDQLSAFTTDIDDGLRDGRITLPDAGAAILGARIDEVEAFVSRMLKESEIQGLSKEDGTKQQALKDAEQRYIIRSGDTLEDIARRFPGRTAAELLRANKELSPDKLQVGTEIIIPCQKRNPEKLLVGIFDMLKADSFETDAKKDSYAADLSQLREKWRIILKMQLISEYLDLEKERDDARKEGKKGKDDIAEKNDIALWQQAVAKILKRNKSFFHRLRQETLQDHYDRFFNSVTRAFGPHTNYISPASKEQFDIHMRGSLEGIGALLREEDGFIRVSSIVPGSASYKTGQLKSGDIILEVAQEDEEPVDITEMRLRDAVHLIRGPKGSTVVLTVKKPDGSKKLVRIVRDIVQLEETFVRSTLLTGPRGLRIGYIYLPSFYRDFDRKHSEGKTPRNSTDDTRKAIEKLKEQFAQGMILDLRDDGGGALVDAVDITGLFIDSGPVVIVKNSFGEEKLLEDSGAVSVYEGPLVVLVNEFSASASEIVAAALQDYGRAVIVGSSQTHGKGSVQTIVDLNRSRPFFSFPKSTDLGALKIMIQKFYRVNGGSTQYKGVEPDIVLPSLFGHIKSGERYLDYSLPWDSIEPVAFTPCNRNLYLKEIKKRSAERVKMDDDFALIRAEAAKAVARSEKTAIFVSLPDLRQRRVETQASEEKIGELYKLHALSVDEPEEESGIEPTKEEKRKQWLKRVQKDPYIREGLNIIADLNELQGE